MKPTTNDVIKAATYAFGVTEDDLKNHGRKNPWRRYRQVVQFMCKLIETDSLTKIAEDTGKGNHATVIHSYRRVGEWVGLYGDISELVHNLEVNLYYMGFDGVPGIPKTNLIDRYDPDIRPRQECDYNRTRVKVTDPDSGIVFVAPSVMEASRLTGLSESAIRQRNRLLYAKRKGGSLRDNVIYEYVESE